MKNWQVNLRKPLEAAGLEVNVDRLLKIVPVVRERIKSFGDIVNMAGFFFHETFARANGRHAHPEENGR